MYGNSRKIENMFLISFYKYNVNNQYNLESVEIFSNTS